MQKPLVSIITPCYNGETFLDRYFESILAQTYSNLELIFVNDGSTDRTEEIALSYTEKLKDKGIQYIYLKQENAGQAAALNRGLKLFTGEYLTWPDSDDVMTPDCVEKKVEFLEKNLQYEICICKTSIVKEQCPEKEIGFYERKKPEKEDCFFEDMLFGRNVYFAPGGYMVRAKALDSVIKNRDIYISRGGQNAQVLLPILYKYRCGYMEDVLYTYYIRDNSHSHSINDSVKIIKQFTMYEQILLETLKRIDEKVYDKYSYDVKCHYSKLRFGNAIDTQKIEVVEKEYRTIKELKCCELKDTVLYLKTKYKLIEHIIRIIKGQ